MGRKVKINHPGMKDAGVYNAAQRPIFPGDKRIENEVEPFGAPGRSDRPAEVDRLNRSHYVNALAALITHERTEVPLTIGIYGEWGTGKSSFMRQLEGLLKRRHQVISFNAWRYHKAEEIWTALVESIAVALDKQLPLRIRLRFLVLPGYVSEARIAIRKLWGRFLAGAHRLENWLTTSVFGGSLLYVIGVINKPKINLENSIIGQSIDQKVISDSINYRLLPAVFIILVIFSLLICLGKLGRIFLRPFSTQFEVYLAQRKANTTERRHMTQMDMNVISSMLRKFGRGTESSKKPPIVVLLDDLDRCPPNRIVEILEAVNLFFDDLPFVTIFGLSSSVVSKAIANEYKFLLRKEAQLDEMEAFGRSFLQKIIHIPFQLPPAGNLDNYVTGLMIRPKEGVEKETDDTQTYFRKEALQEFSGIKRIFRIPSAFYIDFTTWIAQRKAVTSNELMGHGIINRYFHGLGLLPGQEEWINTLPTHERLFWTKFLDKFQGKRPRSFRIFRKIRRLSQSIQATSEEALRKEIEMEEKDADLLKSFSPWLSGNPRTIKRFVNVYQLAKGINAQLSSEQQSGMQFLAAWLVLLQNWPQEGATIYQAASSDPNVFQSDDVGMNLLQELPENLNRYIQKNRSMLFELAKFEEELKQKHSEGFNVAGCFSLVSSHVPRVNQETEL